MKITSAQAIEALKLISGNPVELVEDEAASEYDSEALLNSTDENRGKILRPKIAEELEPLAWEKATGKYGGLLRNKLAKASGMPVSQLTKLGTDEEAVAAAFAYVQEHLQGDASETKKKFDEITAMHQKQIEDLTKDYEAKVTGERNIRLDRDSLDYIKKNILKDIPLPDGADQDILALDYYKSLKDTFHTIYDESGKKIDLFDKEKPTFPAVKQGTSQPLDLKEHATQFLSVRGLVKKDMRDINPAAAMQNQNNLNNYAPPANAKPLPARGARAQRNAERAEFYQQNGLTEPSK